MTTARHAQPRSSDTHGMTFRMFAGIIGAIAVIVAIAFLTNSVSAGPESAFSCGSPVSPADLELISPPTVAACHDALGDRRVWTIPLGVTGLVVALGAVAIRPGRSTKPSA